MRDVESLLDKGDFIVVADEERGSPIPSLSSSEENVAI